MSKEDYMCASAAMKEFNLTKNDLSRLDCIVKRNPHYRNGPCMRLFLIKDLEKLTDELIRKHEQDKIQNAELLRNYKIQAKEQVHAFTTQKEIAFGDFALPTNVVSCIMEKLADSYEPEGIRRTRVVAKDIFDAGMACKDFYNSSKHGFERLSKLIPYVLPDWDNWDAFIEDPKKFKLDECKHAARILKLKIGGTKAEVILRVLDCFGLDQPCNIPANLMRYMECIDEPRHYNIKHMVQILNVTGKTNLNPMTFRFEELAYEFGTMESLQNEYMGVLDEYQQILAERILQESESSRAKQERRKKQRPRDSYILRCNCGNVGSAICIVQSCVQCCRSAECERHKTIK